jgi:pilus assembly protein CpaF
VDGTRRITHVTEVLKMESDVVTLQDLFVAKPVEDNGEVTEQGSRLLGPMICSGIQPQFLHKLSGNGVQLPAQFFMTEAAKGSQPGAQGASSGYGAFGRRS